MPFYRLIDPDEVLDFTINFAGWLDGGTQIDGAPTWTISPTGPTLANGTNTSTAATIYVSGATVGVVYQLTCEVVTNAATPQTANRTITLRCEHR